MWLSPGSKLAEICGEGDEIALRTRSYCDACVFAAIS